MAYYNSSDRKNRWIPWLSTLGLLAVLAAALMFWKPLGENTVGIRFDEEFFSLSSPDGSFRTELAYSEIADVDCCMLLDYGTAADSVSDGSCLFGRFSNEQWGSYMLYVNTNVKYVIVVTDTAGNIVVFNSGNENVTQETASALKDLVNGQTGS